MLGGSSQNAWLHEHMIEYNLTTEERWLGFEKHYFQSFWHPGRPLGGGCAQLERIGGAGDGGKVLCEADATLASIGCQALSVGSNGDFGFEESIRARAPNCAMDTYDPEPRYAAWAPAYVSYYPEFFSSNTSARYTGRTINLLKIDCEGCEFVGLEPFVAATCTDTILMELHGCHTGGHEFTVTHEMTPLRRMTEAHRLMSALEGEYYVYSAEPNVEWSDGTCVEYGLRRRNPCPSSDGAVETPS